MPHCAVLLPPFVDFTLSGESLIRNERSDPLFTLRGVTALRSLYSPPEHFLDPALSPLFGDFAGLPPLLFQASGSEMLLDDSTRAAARAHAAGVKVRFEIWDGLPHVFQALPLPPAGRANRNIVEFIQQECGWS
ncbi:MAG: alpha/beta hydrolase fold domain-containing protein, partial [Burkholderiaceae bacterium]